MQDFQAKEKARKYGLWCRWRDVEQWLQVCFLLQKQKAQYLSLRSRYHVFVWCRWRDLKRDEGLLWPIVFSGNPRFCAVCGFLPSSDLRRFWVIFGGSNGQTMARFFGVFEHPGVGHTRILSFAQTATLRCYLTTGKMKNQVIFGLFFIGFRQESLWK